MYSKAYTFWAKFFIIVQNKCWKQGCFKMNIIRPPCKNYETVITKSTFTWGAEVNSKRFEIGPNILKIWYF